MPKSVEVGRVVRSEGADESWARSVRTEPGRIIVTETKKPRAFRNQDGIQEEGSEVRETIIQDPTSLELNKNATEWPAVVDDSQLGMVI